MNIYIHGMADFKYKLHDETRVYKLSFKNHILETLMTSDVFYISPNTTVQLV